MNRQGAKDAKKSVLPGLPRRITKFIFRDVRDRATPNALPHSVLAFLAPWRFDFVSSSQLTDSVPSKARTSGRHTKRMRGMVMSATASDAATG